jgi:hypothetical protein
MDGRLYVHPVPFDAVRDVGLLTAELAAVDPGLVMLDPAYKYLAGASPRSLFDMGQALTPLQLVCQEARAALLVGHHYNRSEGRDREVRISGAGLLEWARLVITMEAPPRRDHGDVTLRFEITGNSLDPLTFTVERSVEALDDSPNPELRYSARVLAQGAEAVAAMYATASDRVLAVLPDSPEDALPIREIGDRVANDATGKGGLKHDTIRRALNRDLGGRVDSVEPGKPGVETRWWRTE